jgi:hypothetical protein
VILSLLLSCLKSKPASRNLDSGQDQQGSTAREAGQRFLTFLALALAAGSSRIGFSVPKPRLVCQFELPTEQFAAPSRDAQTF